MASIQFKLSELLILSKDLVIDSIECPSILWQSIPNPLIFLSIGSSFTNVPLVGFGTVGTVIQVGSANTISTQVQPGTAVTFTRPGTASTIYDVAQGTLLVVAGISSSP